MSRSSGGNSYNPEMPPPLPQSYSPPDNIVNPEGDFRWYTNWIDKPADAYGLTGLYDPERDQIIVENRLMDYQGGIAESAYTHSDMIEDMLRVGPFPRFPELTVPAECGGVEIGGELTFSGEIPTSAGGAFVSTRRLDDDKEIIKSDDPRMLATYLYKYVHVLALLDFPTETTIATTHNLTPNSPEPVIASRRFELQDAYAELQFADMLPEPVVFPEPSM